jgi:hypothetical protein
MSDLKYDWTSFQVCNWAVDAFYPRWRRRNSFDAPQRGADAKKVPFFVTDGAAKEAVFV